MDMNNIGIVLIHGAGLNSSIWDGLKKEIDQPLLAIDFPNRKMNNNANQTLTFDDYVHSAIQQITNWGCGYFIIVAHSIGACVALKVAEQFKNELKGFVAIGSIIPTNGNSFISTLPFPQKMIMPIILKLFGTKPPAKSIESELCNDLTAEQAHKIVDEFTPEAKALYTTKINFNLPDTRRLYIKLTKDKSIPPLLQDKMIEHLQTSNVVTLDCGHLPMVSKPNQVATILMDFMKEVK